MCPPQTVNLNCSFLRSVCGFFWNYSELSQHIFHPGDSEASFFFFFKLVCCLKMETTVWCAPVLVDTSTIFMPQTSKGANISLNLIS